MESKSAYARQDDGTLTRIPLVIMDDGEISVGRHYNPVELRVVDSTTLRGWGEDDGPATVYRTEAGREIIIPGAR